MKGKMKKIREFLPVEQNNSTDERHYRENSREENLLNRIANAVTL